MSEIEESIMMVMQTVQVFAEKMKTHTLTEYEALMYEQCCNMVAVHCKQQVVIGRAQIQGMERAAYEANLLHLEWERQRNESENRKDRDSPPGDEGTDPDGEGAGQPVQ